MPDPSVKISGRMLKVPEGHLAALLLQQVRKARRQFMGKALAFGAGSAAMAAAPSAATQGEAAFLELPEHTKGLGLPVVTDAYGKPSKLEPDIQRRIEVGDQTWFSKDEELHCIDLMPDGTHRQFQPVARRARQQVDRSQQRHPALLFGRHRRSHPLAGVMSTGTYRSGRFALSLRTHCKCCAASSLVALAVVQRPARLKPCERKRCA